MYRDLLRHTAELAIEYVESLPDRPVLPSADRATLTRTLGGPLPERPMDPKEVISALASAAEPGLVSTAGPRYFGFVIGGSLPTAVAADWLTSAWDQNSGGYVSAPAEAVVEETVEGWLVELLRLPAGTSVGFTTGCQMANFTGLAAARHAVLRRVGWDVEQRGLQGAPTVNVVLGQAAHVTIYGALRYLGLGMGTATMVPTDGHGRLLPDDLRHALAELEGPTIVCAQAGEVNTGACDPLDEIARIVHERDGAWLHVDGAFGLWAAAVPSLRHLLQGHDQADSWATDAHKWLNVPYDSGLVFVRDVAAHRAATSLYAAYLLPAGNAERDAMDYVPEFSRRGRGFAVYAALRSLGRQGLVELIERSCHQARLMATRLSEHPSVTLLNDVTLNQVLVRFSPVGSDDPAEGDRLTQATIARVQADGTCWLGGTTWQGRTAMRISFSSWMTADDDVERCAEVILRCAEAAVVG